MWQESTYKLLGILGTAVKYGCITQCILRYVGDVVVCKGSSMIPTIENNDILFVEHLTPRKGKFRKGDIVICKSPDKPMEYVCKRITGVPGDIVFYSSSLQVVSMGYLWLEGDNTLHSRDSRSYGPVPQGLVHGRALFKIWPFQLNISKPNVELNPSNKYYI